MKQNQQYELIIHHLKSWGFIIPSSEIYGGVNNAWDYGHVGVLLKNKLQQLWWQFFVSQQLNVVGLDSNILLHPQVWVTSGHVANFHDYLVDCKQCHNRLRVDHWLATYGYQQTATFSLQALKAIIDQDWKIVCPRCQSRNFTQVKEFNLMFQTTPPPSGNNSNGGYYLRPETAQGIFINYKNIQRIYRLSLPFGIAQVGKCFRNEITVGHSIFRTREFEQMEVEWFVPPQSAKEVFEEELKKIGQFLIKYLLIPKEQLTYYEVPTTELAHYSQRTVDVQFHYPHGWAELWGLANRGDHDLKLHQTASGENLSYFDHESNQSFFPAIVEPSVGLNRLFYALICAHWHQEIVNQTQRVVLRLPYYLSPYHVAVFGLNKQQNILSTLIYQDLTKHGLDVYLDQKGSIGRRYRRADSLGIKYAITCDFTSLKDWTTTPQLTTVVVTLRDRDSMQQISLQYQQLLPLLLAKTNPFLSSDDPFAKN